ncbi:lanthionine synthetase C family protein [Streptomyces sp. NPDC026672]|uniref:lanthionine synthetase C family protein n=1 Tax=unclassified Streptomyces TaxID=2593676 RepID=UPI0033D861BF
MSRAHEWASDVIRHRDPEEPTGPGLDRGLPGVALLLNEVSGSDPTSRKTAHDLLVRAARNASSEKSRLGLHTGLGGLAFAVKHAAASPRHYAVLRERIDTALRAGLAPLLDTERARASEGRPGTSRHCFDVISGVSGLGRYFLAEPRDADAVRDILGYLVSLTEPVRLDGQWLPGWYSLGWEENEDAVLDLGLSHGAAGPLALLSLSLIHGIRVPDQDTAISRLAEWLMKWRQGGDEEGPWWPSMVSSVEERTPSPLRAAHRRSAWCYGTAGVARALQLAGLALGKEEWTRSAEEGIRGVFLHPAGLRDVQDPGLCHGVAGVMQVAARMAEDLGDGWLASRAAELSVRVCDRFDPDSSFGFPTAPVPPVRTRPLDSLGFLEGAAGVVLALRHQVAPDRTDGGGLGWDSALLLR